MNPDDNMEQDPDSDGDPDGVYDRQPIENEIEPPEPRNIQEEGQYLLRSMVNSNQVFYRFVNRTHRPVDLIWINFTGKLEHVRTLNPTQFVDVNTFRLHIWVAVDSVLKQRMNIDNKSMFICPDVPKQISARIVREFLNITLPVRSLKLTAMLSILEQDLVKSKEDVDLLYLPYSLKAHLTEALRRIQSLQTGSFIIYKNDKNGSEYYRTNRDD